MNKCKRSYFAQNASQMGGKVLPARFALIAICIVVTIATSCSKWCATHCQPQVIIKDSIVNNTIIDYKDTIIYVKVLGERVTDSIPVIIQVPGYPVKISPNKITESLKYCEATAWIKDQKMYLELIQKDTIIAFNLKNAIKNVLTTSNFWRSEVQRISIENKVAINEANKKGRYQGCIISIGILLLILFMIWCFKK